MKNKSYIPILAVLGAIMLVVVAAMAPPQSFFGRDFVHAQTSEVTDDATLFALSLGDGADNQPIIPAGAFMSDTMTYSVRAARETGKVTVTATPNNPEAMVTISPSDRDSADGHQVNLNPGGRNTVIRVTVESEDGSVTETYTVTVYQVRTTPSDDADLSRLSLSDVRLSPSFASDKSSYTGRAVYGTDETTVTATADIGATSVVISPTDADEDASNGHQVALGPGVVTPISVAVTAEDGTARETSYTVMVYRENLVKSDNASLAADDADPPGLTLNSGTIDAPSNLTATQEFDYDPDTKSYPDVRVATGVRAVIVAASTAHAGAMVVITPSDQDPETDGRQVLLSAGAKTDITVKVTAEDGTTTDTYSVTIYRERRVPSDDATLSALSLSGVTLSPAFDSDETSYMGRAAYSTNKPTVSYTADIGAMVDIEGVNTDGDDGDGTPIADADEDASNGHQIALDPGVVTPIAVVVTAEDGDTEKVYIVRVYRENLVKSDDPSLAADDADPPGLTLNSGTIDVPSNLTDTQEFDYDSDTKSYPDVRVDNDVDTVIVAASTTHAGAMVVITPSDQDSLIGGHQVILRAGAKTDITVKVTAEDGTTTDTYSVTIYRERRVPSDDATLSALSLSGVTLSPAFDSDKTSYMGRAAYSTNEPTVSYTADIGAQMVDIEGVNTDGDDGDGTAIDDVDEDASNGHQIALDPGVVTPIAVVVTAEDGDTEKVYIVRVYRENLPPSDNAGLETLTLMGTDESANQAAVFTDHGNDPAAAFEYDATIKSYPNVRVANGVHVVTVEPTTSQPGAAMVITPSDQDSLSGGHQIILGAAAKTAITVEVTAEDGTTTDTYSVTIYRERRVPSNDATLSALSLSDVALSPAFDSDKDEYIGNAANNTQLTTVSYTADIGAQMVEIVDAAENGTAIDDVDGDASNGHQVRLAKGQATVIYVIVTAEGDGPDADNDADTMTYKITVYRDAAVSSDATLQALTLSGITLMPAFDPATTEYTAEVAEALETTTVEAMAAHPSATVEGTGEMSLVAGDNTISVTVTAEDGTSQTYTVTVTLPSSSDATLQMLALSDITLSPEFDSATMEYTATVAYVESTTVSAMATHDGATIDGAGEMSLMVGENTVEVMVTAEDGTTTMTYTVTVTVTAPSSDATLQTLALSGITLSPAFDPATTEYTATVDATVEATTVEAMATHSGAMVEGTGEMSLSEGENTVEVIVTAEDGTTMMTYTVTVTVEMPTLLDRYDADDSDHIDLSEVSAAIDDYFNGDLTLAEVSDVIDLYFQ